MTATLEPPVVASRQHPEPSPAPTRRRRDRWTPAQVVVLIVLIGVSAYFLLPIAWLVISSTKSTADLQTTFGLAFASPNLIQNIVDTFTQDGGIFTRWLLNSGIYAVVGALGATLVSALAGYALAKYRFRGREAIFGMIMAGIVVPQTVLTLPLFLLVSALGLVDTYWAVLLPSLVTPFGVYLSRIYADASVPDELLEAGRLDGSGEWRLFFTVSLRIMSPALVTVFLFQFVGIWNNFFLPLIVLRDTSLYPVTLGLYSWNTFLKGDPDLLRLIVTGSLISVIPLAILFFTLQRYWRSGLTAGSVK